MTPETLDRAIDAMVAGDLTSSHSDEAVAAASLMTMASQIPVSAGRSDVRRAVLTAAAAPRRPWLRRGLVLAPVAASLAFSGVAVAARTALPGDALYQVRRGMQAVRVAVAIGDHSKAVALLDRAERDVVDAERALARGRESDARKALRAFAADIATARSEIARLDAAVAAPLTERADALQSRADRVAAGAEDEGEGPSGSDDSNSGSGSGDDDSNSGSGSDDSGSDDSGSDDSGSDDSNSGPGSDDSGSDDSGSDDSGSSGGSSSGSGSDDDSSSGSGSDDSGSSSGSGSSGSGSDDDASSSSSSGSDDSSSSSGSGSDD